MQVLPLLTPTHFNNKKRSRSEDDFDSNYLKKRLISTFTPTTPPQEIYNDFDNETDYYSRGLVTPSQQIEEESKFNVFTDDMEELVLPAYNNNKTILNSNNNDNNRIHFMNMFKNNIPEFKLNKEISIQHNNSDDSLEGQLILYRPNPLLPISPPTTPTITEIDDDEEEEEFEAMDLD